MSLAQPYIPRAGERAAPGPRHRRSRSEEFKIWWREIDRVARSFLDELWRCGMLDGATAEEAYFVRCDETTNPPEETMLGRLTCLIGVRPPWPAEFVVVRIGKTLSGTETVETVG